MHGILTVFLIVGLANAISIVDLMDLRDWQLYKYNYGKIYWNTFEEQYRYRIFQQNKHFIEAHNRLYEADKVPYALGLNEFSDMTNKEYNDLLNNYNQTQNDEDGITFIAPEYLNAPQTVDWRSKGAVTPVKMQGSCGACWAFSATGAVEGQHYRKTGKLISLSEQNLIDCSAKFGNHGCKGGRAVNAFRYIIANKGIDTESAYPYKTHDGRCSFNQKNIGATVRGVVNLKRGDEPDLLKATAAQGPISVNLDATQKTFQFYKSGVYDDDKCNANKLNHAMLVVGYGTEWGHDYWLVKNSWSKHWGDQGYIKIMRNKNRCGIANDASYPLV